MQVVRLAILFAFAAIGAARADTPSDVWNVTVTMSVPPSGSNPLSGQTYQTFAKAHAAMRNAHTDALFLVQKEETVGTYADVVTQYWIPPGDVAFWGAWTYSGIGEVISAATGCDGLEA
jgi:hypothetical protein